MTFEKRIGRFGGAPGTFWSFLALLAALVATGMSPDLALNAFGAEGEADNGPVTSRQLYNEGTEKLKAGKLGEAETSLQSAVSSQDEKVQVPSLFNLGHTRYRQGAEALAKGPDTESARAAGQRAFGNGSGAMRAADEALAGDDLSAIVGAYMRARGSRKELKAATEAARRSMDMFGGVLTKWRRARGDFASAHELRQSDTDAKANADMVDGCIAKLLDLQQMMMQSMAMMGKQRGELRKKMEELRKRMPKDMGEEMKGSGGEDDDDEEGKKNKQSFEPKVGDTEGQSKDGQAHLLTPEEAMRLLGMLKLDTDRKLSMGEGDTGELNKKKGRDW